MAKVTAIEEGRVNMRRSVTMEHCFKNKETCETTRRGKTPRWLLYMKGNIYLKQKILKNTFEAKICGKALLV